MIYAFMSEPKYVSNSGEGAGLSERFEIDG